jgi:uncharacterized protein (DUF2062 family)
VTDTQSPSLIARGRALVARFLRWLIFLRGSPEAIGRGVAIGILVALTPTIGFQILLSAGLATLVGGSRPAAVLMTAITSPPTFVPIYGFTYWIGSLVWAGPPVSEVTATLTGLLRDLSTLGWTEVARQIGAFAAVGRDIFVPLWLGGFATGIVAGGGAYLPTVRFVRFSRKRLRRVRERRSERRARRTSRTR